MIDTEHPKYFDYLDDYGEILARRFDIHDLVQRINHWRVFDGKDPASVAAGCRTFVELILKSLVGSWSETKDLELSELIKRATKQKLFDERPDGPDKPSLLDRMNEIRDYGNNAVHRNLINTVNASKSLTYLDEILRYYISENIDSRIIYPVIIRNDSVFANLSDEILTDLLKRAEFASSMIDDSSIKDRTESVVETAKKKREGFRVGIKGICDDLDLINKNFSAEDEIEKVYDSLDALYYKVVGELEESNSEIEHVEKEIEEILNEFDFIKMLLNNEGDATDEQMEILAFPKGLSSSKNILQISGSAGTGKTLCLLAKLIKEIGNSATNSTQTNMIEIKPKTVNKGLFVCFNTQLENYVNELLAKFPDIKNYIDVIHVDSLINKLAKPVSANTRESKYDAYVNDGARYPFGYSIFYHRQKNSPRLLEQAMQEISTLYPNRADEYYLNYNDRKNVSWMDDEMSWLESRYDSIEEASSGYFTEERSGRGTERTPSEDERKVILKVWKKFRELLEANKRYTTGQAVRRLSKSRSLPKYDFIAIDEAQDFTVASILLLLKFRAVKKAPRTYIAGDEGQKIFKRDFSWKEVGSCEEIVLHENKRNPTSIANFAERLQGKDAAKQECSKGVEVCPCRDNYVLQLAEEYANSKDETTVLITKYHKKWRSKIQNAGLDIQEGNITQPGLHLMSEFNNKGLEFDNVIIVGMNPYPKDMDAEKRLRYVHFTRARKRLFVLYNDMPELLQKYYPDFL